MVVNVSACLGGGIAVAWAPCFPAALFVLWAVLIAVLAWVVERGHDRSTAED
jgi:type III secretory pathway component EscV